ncbi:MAG: hypothetical protein FJX72_07925 [Armatimonadetes bacterium]|nr:hypothetical protein [Armatimonadota bacterium]
MPDTEPDNSPAPRDQSEGQQTTSPEPESTPDDAAIAKLLAARGVPPDEITRLLQVPAGSRAPDAPATSIIEPTEVLAARAYKPDPALTLPEFREPTARERDEAERLLRDAHLARRRGRFAEASERCLAAIAKTPSDAAALEMLGDIMQALGRVDDAVVAYHRAGEADPRRASAERKYAALVLMQDRATAALTRQVEPRNPYMAVMLSAVCPGAGQYYNGETLKGLILAVVVLGLLICLLWTPLGFAGTTVGLSPTSGMLLAGIGITYVISLADARAGASRPRSVRTGWDV